MKVVNSIGTLKKRHPDCQVVKRKGRVYVINKTTPGSRSARAARRRSATEASQHVSKPSNPGGFRRFGGASGPG